MISRQKLISAGFWLVFLGFASGGSAQIGRVYGIRKLAAERARLESRTSELWQMMYEHLLEQDEQAVLAQTRPQFPTHSPDGSALNFFADWQKGVIYLPIHSLLLLEDICTAYAWRYHNGYSMITINEYASMLKYRRQSDFPGGKFPPPLQALGIPDNALANMQVSEMSLRFRNSAWAYILAHEMGHIRYRHPGNAVRAEISRRNERQADDFALQVLGRDEDHIPMGAILFFQMMAFTASPGRFDYSSVEEWQKALQRATHPITSDRVRGLAAGLRNGNGKYGANQMIALDVASQLNKLAGELDDRDWHFYFRRIGEHAPISRLQPRRE